MFFLFLCNLPVKLTPETNISELYLNKTIYKHHYNIKYEVKFKISLWISGTAV